MKCFRLVLTWTVSISISAGCLSQAFGQFPSRPLAPFGTTAWEARLSKPPNEALASWKGALEEISQGYSQRWFAYASAADRGDSTDGVEDPLEHSFLGIKDGARTLLVPEGMLLAGSGGVDAVRVLEGDTMLRLPGSLLAEKGLRGFSSEGARRSVSVRLQAVGIHTTHNLHPTHAASVSRLVSDFRLPDDEWTDQERNASAAWMEQLRKTSIDYVLIERLDPELGFAQMVLPVRASLISPRASSFIERHIDSFAALPIEPDDRVTCIDSAMLPTIWLPWKARQVLHRASRPDGFPSQFVPSEHPKCFPLNDISNRNRQHPSR